MRLIVAAIVVVIFTGCDDAKFSSTGSDKDNNSNQQPFDPYRSENQNPGSPTPAPGQGGIISKSGGKLCLGQSLNLNIVLVFDRSGSQSDDDQDNMEAGARGFITNLNKLSTEGKRVAARASVVRFNGDSQIGANRWQDIMTAGGMQTTFTDIGWANSGNSGDTHYHEALANVETLLNEIKAQVSNANSRNFVVFLSDGEPDSQSKVMPAAQSVLDKFGVAYISIGIGIEDEQYLRQMAALKNPQTPQDHTGQYIDADSNAADVANAFAKTETIIRNICQ